MNTLNILSLNINTWMPVNTNITLNKKLEWLYDYIVEDCGTPEIVFLQELFTGEKQKYIDKIEELFDEYIFVKPKWDFAAHPRSIYCGILIRKDIVEDVEVVNFDYELKNRVVFCKVTLNDETAVYLLNLHAPQIYAFNGHQRADVYVRSRIALHMSLITELVNTISNYQDSPVFVGGDWNRIDLSALEKIGFKEYTVNDAPTIKNSFAPEDRIDRILINNKAQEMVITGITYEDREPMRILLSDHVAVCMSLFLAEN